MPDTTTFSPAGLRLILLDADGVLWRGASALPHAAGFVERARLAGLRCVLVSNNSTKDRRSYAELCARLGIALGEADIFSSNHIAGPWLARERPGQSVLVLGSAQLHGSVAQHVCECWHAPAWLAQQGLSGFSAESGVYEILASLKPGIVLSGMDTATDYLRHSLACIAIQQGAELIGTNDDISFPVEGGWLLPGSGSQLGMYAAVCGVEPLVLGKPGLAILEQVELETGIPRSAMLMIGDRPDTDMALARRAGIPGMLVLTGVTGREAAESLSPRPLIISDLREAMQLLGI
ncbi:HAD-IIA family hydrolase [bacterium]|nr:HAD-IIA family hydrolase [bacterium]